MEIRDKNILDDCADLLKAILLNNPRSGYIEVDIACVSEKLTTGFNLIKKGEKKPFKSERIEFTFEKRVAGNRYYPTLYIYRFSESYRILRIDGVFDELPLTKSRSPEPFGKEHIEILEKALGEDSEELVKGIYYDYPKEHYKVRLSPQRATNWLGEHGYHFDDFSELFGFDGKTFKLKRANNSSATINFYPKQDEGLNMFYLMYALVSILKNEGEKNEKWIEAMIPRS